METLHSGLGSAIELEPVLYKTLFIVMNVNW